MIYVVDGIDCSGKSTLVEELSKKTGYEVVKGSSFEIASLGADYMHLHMMNLLKEDDIIVDRYFFSNYVYARTHEYPLMSDEQFDSLYTKLIEVEKNVCLIYLYADENVIAERISVRGDDYIDKSYIADILRLYGEVLNRYRIPEQRTIRLDTGKIELDEMSNVATTIINYVGRLNEMPEKRNY
jgi:thymidylate kinase